MRQVLEKNRERKFVHRTMLLWLCSLQHKDVSPTGDCTLRGEHLSFAQQSTLPKLISS